MWDQVYDTEEFKYGTEPNVFFAENIKLFPPGKILFPAEGEGRNAVFSAQQGWDVTAFDQSIIAQQKALSLAREKGVEIEYLHGGFEEMPFHEASFDCVVLVFAHFQAHRELYHQIVSYWLKPGGIVLLEGFSKAQKGKTSGGPKNPEVLFSEEELRSDFQAVAKMKIAETTIDLNEGRLHNGKAEVIRMIGVK